MNKPDFSFADSIMKHIVTISLAIVFFIVGGSWFGLRLWESLIHHGIISFGKDYLTDTYYWGENRTVKVEWQWRKVQAPYIDENTHETTCLVNIEFTNQDSLRFLSVYGINISLSDKHNMIIHEYDYDEINLIKMNTGGTRGYDKRLKPMESQKIIFKYYAPTTIINRVKKVGLRLSYRLSIEFEPDNP